MSKSVASESNEGCEGHKTCRKRGSRDEGKKDEEGNPVVPPAESLTISTVVSTVPATTDQFMHTPEFRRHFVEYVPDDTLMVMRLVSKPWMREIENLLRRIIENGGQRGELIAHGGNDMSFMKVKPQRERRKLVSRVVFLLNITKVGVYACDHTINLVVVDIPEGVESIGDRAFFRCSSLTTVSFPKTLTFIDTAAFAECISLENVDLLHTNLQELGMVVFDTCSELNSMTIPDSLQTLGWGVFANCDKLVPSDVIDARKNIAVVIYLRSLQQQI